MDSRFIQDNLSLLIWLLATVLSILLALHLAGRNSIPNGDSERSGPQPSVFKKIRVFVIGVSAALCMAGFAYFFVDRLIKGLKRTILNNAEWAGNIEILAFIVPVILFLIIACYVAAIEIFTDSFRVFKPQRQKEVKTAEEVTEAVPEPELVNAEMHTDAGDSIY